MRRPALLRHWLASHWDASRWNASHWVVIGGSLCLALFFAFLGRQALDERETLWQLQMNKQAEVQRMALHSTQHGLQERAQLLAETIAADAWVVELVRQAHALPANELDALASIRSQLYTRLAPRWRNLQAHQTFRLYVHLAPDIKVLLRVHEPEHFGDLQIGWRPMVLEALRSATSQAGLGLSRGSIGMRAIAPLLVEGADTPLQVGAIEVAMGVLDDLAQLDRDLGSGVALLLREELLLGTDSGEELRGLASDPQRWRLMGASRPQALAWQRQQALPPPAAGDAVRLLADGERHYLLNQIVLTSYRQRHDPTAAPQAVALVWRDVSEQFDLHRSDKRWLVVKWLLAWCGAEALLLVLLRTTKRSTQRLMQRQQAAVREARAYLQALLDSATGVSIIATDPQGRINLFNSGAERLLGYSAAEMIGKQTPAVFHLAEEMQARAAELSAQAGRPVEGFEVFVHNPRGGEPETRQWTYRCQDGSLRPVNLTVSAMFDGSGRITGFLGIASDIGELQQATRALQKSESRFRGLVANLPGVVYRCANDADWSMRYVSEEILSLSGYPPSDFIDNRVRSFSSIVHPDDLAITYRAGEAIERQEIFELTYRLRHADGHNVWVREKGRGEYDSQGRLLWVDGFLWDISERQAIEDELRLSQQRFRNAFTTAPQGMALVAPDGRWLEVNDALCQMLGYPREELLATSYQSVTHPEDLEADLENAQDLLAGRINAYQMEKRYLDKQGQVLWVLLSVSLVRDGEGRPVHFVAQIQDFSDRVAAERAVREREHYLRTLLDNVIDAIVTIDEAGRIETFNHAAEHIFGYRHAEVAGCNVSLLMPEPYRSAHDGYIQRYLRTGEAWVVGQSRELEGLRRSGERFAMELAVSQISHQGQRRFIAVIRDIAERKRIEQMKNEFVSTVSHELRTPLTAIAGSLGLINGGALGAVPDTMQQMLAIAQSNSQRLNELINDLLDMDKLVAGKMHFELQAQPLQPLLEQALLHNQPYADQHRVRLRLQVEGDAAVRVDGQRLAQVMANLLSNAAKFSPPGGQVEVRLQRCAEVLRVAVTDHGPGIPDAFKPRIFSKFSQADAGDTRQMGGTGLGLAICKEIVERMGGHIGFDSREGRGACFWFELPITGSET
ncbi:PAS domain S-box protein [Pseudomonas sp. NPDC077649]|uniref:PAS domain S-box protein n=1 Tax=Pseudomonas sp. NPDC077649 TaxID=3364423 RepID=UPI0037C6E635